MNGKIGPIPTVIIWLVLGIALVIDVPMVLLHTVVQRHLTAQDQAIDYVMMRQDKALITPTATPAAKVTPTPTPLRKSSSIRSVATPAATVQAK